nr:ATP synthase F0 subunit 8 [Apotropina sp. 1 JJC-2023a]
MPQMAPINWLILFIMFSMIFLLFNMMNFYSILPNSPKLMENKSMKKINFNWKW